MDRAPPTFSIITVCLNAERTLGRTLESMQAQTCRDFEYLVVDGGSRDGTLDLIRGSGLPVSVVSEPDRGISDAFNKGVQRARGEWLGFLNADDWYEPDTLAVAARAAEHHPDWDVICGRQRYFHNGRPTATFDVNPALLRSFMSVNHIASFSRRALYQRFGGFREHYRYAMDYELYLRFFCGGVRFGRVDAVLANMGLGGASDRHWRRSIREVRQAQLDNGVNWLAAQRRYLFQLSKGGVRRAAERLGARGLVDLYRGRLARVRRSLD